jgi:hypothetical protein
MGLISRIVAIGLLLWAVGCTSAPKQTVELAEIVDHQIAEMQVSHEKFVRLYYDKLRDDVERSVEDKWIPSFLSNVIEGKEEGGKQFRTDLDKAYKLATVDWENAIKISAIEDASVREAVRDAVEKLITQENAALGSVLLDFSKGVHEEINKQRKLLMQPIDKQEAFVLDHLRTGYALLQRSSAAVKGYLASVVELVQQREAVLDKLGVLEEERKMVDLAVKLNDAAVRAMNTAGSADEGIGKFLDDMEKTQDLINNITHLED